MYLGILAVDYVVLGKRMQKQGGSIEYVALHYQGAATGYNEVAGGYVRSLRDADTVLVSVNVDVSGNNNLPAAKIAAENVARALTKLVDQLEDDPTATVSWNDGELMSASEVLDLIEDTTWIISDQSDFGIGEEGRRTLRRIQIR